MSPTDLPQSAFRETTTLCQSPDPASNLTDRLNQLLSSGGTGYVLSLCPGQQYHITKPLIFTAPNQEISTQGYPSLRQRATLVVAGPVADGRGHTTAVDGTCTNCDGVKLRNVQIDGTRNGSSPTRGGANIEMGGNNSGQLIEHVRSYDPRSWSCLHVAEGPLSCSGVIIQNNDIGPCGVDTFQEWADGISLSCASSIVRNNIVFDATDGGIVISGSPGSIISTNTISVNERTCRGGITMVNSDGWGGNYINTVVRDNNIMGGFASREYGEDPSARTKGRAINGAMIKIGLAIGPRAWFGDRYPENVSYSGTVLNNHFSGALGYAIAITSAHNFTVNNNTVFGNVTFIGSQDPNCTNHDTTPNPGMFVIDRNNTEGLSIQPNFTEISNRDSLTCILPPDGDHWPFRDTSFDNTGFDSMESQTAWGVLFIVIMATSYFVVQSILRFIQNSHGQVEIPDPSTPVGAPPIPLEPLGTTSRPPENLAGSSSSQPTHPDGVRPTLTAA